MMVYGLNKRIFLNENGPIIP